MRFASALLCALLAACGPAEQPSLRPLEITRDTVCSLDGMILADYPGPKAQIHYDQGPPDFFCDTLELFSIYLRPEQQKRVRALYVQDMGKADWNNPQGHWIDARSAFFVHGSKKHGSMGPTLASFAREEDARSFAGRYGGKVLRFAEVTPDMVSLDGGALHDQKM
ncbi:MAG: nitrous oxide reductase accessory protein NosL [Pseudomonadota bacterium]|jgi:copper chaperone NosL